MARQAVRRQEVVEKKYIKLILVEELMLRFDMNFAPTSRNMPGFLMSLNIKFSRCSK